MIDMMRMVAIFFQQNIVGHMISLCHQLCILNGMCNCIHLALSHKWGIAVLLLVHL